MTKHGRYLSFGYALRPSATDPERPLQLAAMAENLGLDYLTILPPAGDSEQHDPWTLMTAVGMATSRIMLVANGSEARMRSPAALAKAAASLDLLTHGRVQLALDSQTPWQPSSTGSQKTGSQESSNIAEPAALQEAVQTIRGVWSGEHSTHSASGASQPDAENDALAPARRIGIWLSAQEPEFSALAGTLGDGLAIHVNPSTLPTDLAQLCERANQAAASAGRELSELQRVWYIAGTIGEQERHESFQGTAQQWADSLADFAMNAGIDTFILVEGENAEQQLEKFANEVIPLTLKTVERLGGTPVPAGLSNARQGAGASGATPIEDECGDVDLVDETSMESFPASDPPASSSFT